MAFRGDYKVNKDENTLNPMKFNNVTKGFDVGVYRENNKLKIFLAIPGSGTLKVFEAFYSGGFNFDSKINMGSYSSSFKNLMKMFGGASWHSLASSVGKHYTNEDWGLAFDAPLKPYLNGTEPIAFDFNCFLPLIVEGDGSDTFQKNIEQPLNNLIVVTMPTRSEAADKLVEDLISTTDKGINWMTNLWMMDDSDDYAHMIKDAIVDYRDNFFKDVYMLNNPFQFAKGAKLVIRIGPWRLSDVIIDTFKVEYGPIIYTDGNDGYPEYAKVSIHCTTTYSACVETFNIGRDMSEEISKLYDTRPHTDKSSGAAGKS